MSIIKLGRYLFERDTKDELLEKDVVLLKGEMAIETDTMLAKVGDGVRTYSQLPYAFRGEKGDKGDQGIQGIQGIKGEVGPQGKQGIQGIQGVPGPKGEPGTSIKVLGVKSSDSELPEKSGDGDCYFVNGSLFVYTQGGWLDAGHVKGEKGEKGDQGEKGEKGDQGIQGIQGVRGEKGDQGIQGIQGVRGDRGEKGEPGRRGDMGFKGERGEPGARGERGPIGPKGDKGDCVELTVKLDGQLEKITTDCVDVSNDVSTLKKDVQTLGEFKDSTTKKLSDLETLKKDVQTWGEFKDSTTETLSDLNTKVSNISTDKISNKNGGSLSFWTGTQSQYNSIYSKDSNTIYFITE